MVGYNGRFPLSGGQAGNYGPAGVSGCALAALVRPRAVERSERSERSCGPCPVERADTDFVMVGNPCPLLLLGVPDRMVYQETN